MKKWHILSKGIGKSKKLGSQEIIEILLANRGIKGENEREEFLNPVSPYKLESGDLGINKAHLLKAIQRIKKAINTGEKIIIYGDYDADGVCATAILWETLYNLKAYVMPFIPRREEGYGLKVEKIEEFFKAGVRLIITVDQGIVAVPQIEHAKKLGIDVIVTDHHLPGKKKPRAFAIIHTVKLSGAGISWFLAKNLGECGLDLATIGTVSDLMPLLGANRCLVFHGLPEVRKTERIGLQALYKVAGITPENIGVYEIGFLIGPRLNAAGRLEDPMDSLRLVCTRDRERAKNLAEALNQKNRLRQEMMEQTFIHAKDLWLKEDGKSLLIFVGHESYHEGIIGLAAGKLTEEFSRPAIVVAKGERYSRASARSINGFSIIEAVRACSDILGDHGGHSMAAGFSFETVKFEEIKTRFLKFAQEKLNKESLSPVIKIDLEMDLEHINFSLFNDLRKLEPFGLGNPEPVFLSRNLTLLDARLVGSDGRHLKLRVSSPSSRLVFEAIGFGMGDFFKELSPGGKIDLVYSLTIDQWNQEKRLQLKVKDLRLDHGEKI